MVFHFELHPLAEVSPWGGPEKPNLHWFALTEGVFWIEAGTATLFQYALSALADPNDLRPYVDYYVVRLWEDLLEILPDVLSPIPPDLARRVLARDAWESFIFETTDRRGREELSWEQFEPALSWWWHRELNTGYVNPRPHLHLFRVEDTVSLRWDSRTCGNESGPVWTALFGEVAWPVSEFIAEVRSFHERFMNAMAERVAEARRHWPQPGVSVDLNDLDRQQEERAGWLKNALTRPPSGDDWDTVQAAMRGLSTALA